MGRRILVIDDDPIARRVATWLLEARGHVALGAADAESGLARVRADRPDLVITDVGLPDLDGCEVVRRLKAEAPSLPVLALTAAITDDERARVDAAGFDGRLEKPIRAEHFADRVEAFLR
jgi:CheY-like chemotaxis protein